MTSNDFPKLTEQECDRIENRNEAWFQLISSQHIYFIIQQNTRFRMYVLSLVDKSDRGTCLYYVLVSASHPKVPEDEADPGP